MKKLIASVMVFMTFSSSAFATCDFSTGVTKNDNGSYTYTKECHVAVGQMKNDLETANGQIVEYKKVIELKDLAITKSDQRADMWMDSSFKLQDRLNTVDELKSKNQYLAFALGILVTGLAVYGAGQLRAK
jgi:hypothetical protein